MPFDAPNNEQQTIHLASEAAHQHSDHEKQPFPKTEQDETTTLRSYLLAKQDVVTAVRAAKHYFQTCGTHEEVEQCQTLIVQLAEDRFNLAVVGQFKRGKSTLMNALLGRDLLPTGLLPLTSAITTLCYGPRERVVLRRKGGGTMEQEVPLTHLANFITERGNPGNQQGLLEARVELPLPFLRHGLHFIDTPGIGSARHENTATTYAFLPQMAAVIFVTSVEAPLSDAEERFLLDIRAQVRHLFVVVNKMDLLGETEREELLGYIRTRITDLLGQDTIALFPLSARPGLVAKLSQDEIDPQRNGLASFEQALTTFLAEEQGRAFLVSILDRALHLFAETELTPASMDTHEGELSTNAATLYQTLESLRTSLLTTAPLAETRHPTEQAADLSLIDRAIAAGRSQKQVTHEIQENTHARTCPICTALVEALFTFFATWQYQLATDPAIQHAFAAAHGLCPVHTWQFEEMASPLGISDGYAPFIETLATELSHLLEDAEHAATPLATLLAHPTTCAACRLVHTTACEHVEHLLASLNTMEGRTSYASSPGLCLPHLQLALAQAESHAEVSAEHHGVARFLLHEQMQRLERLTDDLRSYTLKRDALRRGLVNQEEDEAWRRALVQLVGERAARGGAMMITT